MPQLLDKTIEILGHRHLLGPNMWSYNPALEVLIDIGDLEDYPSDLIPGFYQRLYDCLPSLHEHRCSYGEPGGFLKRVEEGTWPGHILEHLTIELQNLAGISGGFGRARDGGRRGVYKVIVSASEEVVTLQAFKYARDLLLTLIKDNGNAIAQTKEIIDALRDLGDEYCLGPSTACIVNAAAAREIPYIRLSRGNLVQLGYGAKQRRIWTAETDQTSAIAESISRDKDLTKSLLASAGVPTPEGRVVTSANDAWEAAQEIGTPVVVKPIDGNHGRGVFINLYTQQEIEAAYAVAIDEGSDVLVERHILGDEHRLLVVGNRVVAAAKGETVWIEGDGQHTVDHLIQIQINSDPRRGTTEECPLNLVRIDAAVQLELARQNLSDSSIPALAQKVLIQSNGNVAFDVTDLVHPEVASQVTLAARVVGLEIAGIDLVAQDISKPLESQHAAIVEVNAGPGLLMHLKPAKGKPRAVGEAIANHLFPLNEDFRIPVIGISGETGKTLASEMIAHFLRLTNIHIGLSSSKGLYFGNRSIKKTSNSDWENARRTLLNRAVELAVIENSNSSLLLEGLAYDQCQVGIVLNVNPSALFPEYFIADEDQLFNVMRTQIDVVLPDGVSILNGDDLLVVKMAELSKGEVMYFTENPNTNLITEHQKKNGRTIVTSPKKITLLLGKQEKLVVEVPASLKQYEKHEWPPHLSLAAALGAAWALNTPFNLMKAGIDTFVLNDNIPTEA
jgi:cyanophycin synthetase